MSKLSKNPLSDSEILEVLREYMNKKGIHLKNLVVVDNHTDKELVVTLDILSAFDVGGKNHKSKVSGILLRNHFINVGMSQYARYPNPVGTPKYFTSIYDRFNS